MKKQTLIFNNLIYKEGFNPYLKKEYFAIPVIPIKVALKYDVNPQYNHFERAILTLLLSKTYTNHEISEILLIDAELVELIINTLISKGDLDKQNLVTKKAEDTLKGIYKESSVVVKYAFYDLNRGRLLKETASPESLSFNTIYFDNYSDYNSNDISNYYNRVVITSDLNDYSINFTVVDLNSEKSIDVKKIEAMLNRERLDTDTKNQKVLISATVIEVSNFKHYLLSYVDTFISSANTNRWNVRNPLTLKVDLELQNFFYYSNSNKIVSLIIETLMKSRSDIINKDIDKKQLFDYIKNKLFINKIDNKHDLFIEPLMYILDSISLKDVNAIGESTNIQIQESLKMAMIYFGQLFESLLYQAAIEYKKEDLQNIIDLLKENRKENNLKLCSMAKESIGFTIAKDNISLFNITKNDLNQMFKMGKEYVLSACVSMNILIAHNDDNYFIKKLSLKHKDFITKLDRLKKIRDEKRHTTSNCDVTIKDFLTLAFDVMDLAFGYKVNKESLDKYFASKVSLYDYSYSLEYVRNRVGTNFFDSKDAKAITIKNHLIEVHKKYVENQSDYIASAHSIIEDLYKEILKTILLKKNIKNDFKLKSYFNSGKDFEEYIEILGFDINIDQDLFNTEVKKALAVDSIKTEALIKQGLETKFEKSTNRIKMQSLILLFKLNNNLVNDFLINKYNLKKLFKLTSIVMFIDRSHQQNNYYNHAQATYIVNELIDLVKNAYNNGKVINWRN